MSRMGGASRWLARCFPRVSGDEPVTLRANVADFKFSPRERG